MIWHGALRGGRILDEKTAQKHATGSQKMPRKTRHQRPSSSELFRSRRPQVDRTCRDFGEANFLAPAQAPLWWLSAPIWHSVQPSSAGRWPTLVRFGKRFFATMNP